MKDKKIKMWIKATKQVIEMLSVLIQQLEDDIDVSANKRDDKND